MILTFVKFVTEVIPAPYTVHQFVTVLEGKKLILILQKR